MFTGLWNNRLSVLMEKMIIFIHCQNQKIMGKKTTNSAQTQARSSTGQFIKEIRRHTAKVYTSEQRILINNVE